MTTDLEKELLRYFEQWKDDLEQQSIKIDETNLISGLPPISWNKLIG